MTDTQQQDAPVEQPKPTSPANGGEQAKAEPIRVPDDHPLATAHERQKAENAELKRRLAEYEDSKKSETERAADRAAQAEKEIEAIPSKVAGALKSHLVALHKISDDDAALFLTSTDPETLLKQVDRLVKRDAKPLGYVPSQGTADPASAQVSSYELGAEAARARYQKNP